MKGDIDTDIDVEIHSEFGCVKGHCEGDVDIDVDIASDFGSLKGVSKSVHILINGINALIHGTAFDASEMTSPVFGL